MKAGEINVWKTLFWGLVAAYCWYYAPYGINETDGGFITGLAWQLLNGKTLYAGIVYVRPPVPVWLRAAEMCIIPDQWAVLGERWLFYGKVALYAWLGAATLSAGARRWILAAFAFVVSVHCYPPAAWHTVDGILLGALSIWLFCNWRSPATAALSGLCLAGCVLCKQSFYPMPLILGGLLFVYTPRRPFIISFSLIMVVFAAYLYCNGTLSGFWRFTGAAASGGQALQHGVLDYFRIRPPVAVVSAVLLLPVARWFLQRKGAQAAFISWILLLIFLTFSYLQTIVNTAEFTVPFAQSRVLFWIAAAWGIFCFWQKTWDSRQTMAFFALLGLSWCASVSWGYNLPILFALPWVYAVFEISASLSDAVLRQVRPSWLPALALAGLLALFRVGYEFVYRDGPRAGMQTHLGEIFPKLNGIYSSAQTAVRYRELHDLAARYGPNFKTLPSFPQSNFLTNTYPPLPLDWVVQREMQAGTAQVKQSLQQGLPVLFIEKGYGSRLNTDPELQLTMECLLNGKIVEETAHFWVVTP